MRVWTIRPKDTSCLKHFGKDGVKLMLSMLEVLGSIPNTKPKPNKTH